METIFNFLRKKFIWVPIATMASICTIILFVKSCSDDQKERKISENISIINSSLTPLKPVNLNDSILLFDSLIVNIRKVQDEILFYRSFVSLLSFYEAPYFPEELEDQWKFYKTKALNIHNTFAHIFLINSDYKSLMIKCLEDSISAVDPQDLVSLESACSNDSIYDLQKHSLNMISIIANGTIPIQEKVRVLKQYRKDEEYIQYFKHVYEWSEEAYKKLNQIQLELQVYLTNK